MALLPLRRAGPCWDLIPCCRSGSTDFEFGCQAASRLDPTGRLYDVGVKTAGSVYRALRHFSRPRLRLWRGALSDCPVVSCSTPRLLLQCLFRPASAYLLTNRAALASRAIEKTARFCSPGQGPSTLNRLTTKNVIADTRPGCSAPQYRFTGHDQLRGRRVPSALTTRRRSSICGY